MSDILLRGTLSGGSIPQATTWGDPPVDLLIVSGGKLQCWDGSTLTTVDDSPTCDIVSKGGGRVIVASTLSDRISMSGVGDYTDWQFNGEGWTAMNAIWVDIGYKSGGNITSIATLNKDVVVFKADGVCYRIVGAYPDWSVVEIGRNITNINRFTVVQESNDVFFLDRHFGIHSIGSVAEYGDVKVSKFGKQINLMLSQEIGDGARLWNVPSRTELWVKPDDGFKWVYVLNLITGAWTVFSFPLEPVSVFSLGSTTYLSMKGEAELNPNGFVYTMDRSVDADFGTVPIRGELQLRPLVGGGSTLIKKCVFDLDGTGDVDVDVNGNVIASTVLSGTERLKTRQILFDDEMRLRLVSNEGRTRIRQIVVDMVQI